MIKNILVSLFTFISCISIVYAQEKIVSFYSSTNTKHVASIANSEREKDPEIDYFIDLCPGYGGYELVHSGGDLRSLINIKFGKKVSDLFGPTMNLAQGSFAHKSNDVVEWRGTLNGSHFVPHAIIYRLTGYSEVDANGKQQEKTSLIVIALNKGDAKVLGSTKGKDEGEKARKLADSVLQKK